MVVADLEADSGYPRYAYVEFSEPSLVAQALVLNESVFRGRNLKVRELFPAEVAVSKVANRFIRVQVVPKRTNLPGMSRGRGRGGFRGRGGYGRGGFPPRGGYRGGGYRGRGRGGYAPY